MFRLCSNLLEKSRETSILSSSSFRTKPNQTENRSLNVSADQINAVRKRSVGTLGRLDGRSNRPLPSTSKLESQYILQNGDVQIQSEAYHDNLQFPEDDLNLRSQVDAPQYNLRSPDRDSDTFSDFERKQFKACAKGNNINIKVNPNYM